MHRSVTDRHVVGKDDPHLRKYIQFLSVQIGRPNPETIAGKFLHEAIRRHGQFRRSGCPHMRFYTWLAVQRVASALSKEAR
jgi:hypothetical protein